MARGQVVTVHDCIALTYDPPRAAPGSLYMRLSTRIYQHCACIVFISEDVQRQFDQFYAFPDIPQKVIASGAPLGCLFGRARSGIIA